MLKITGPPNSDVDLPSIPPSTRISLLKLPSVGLIIFNPGSPPISSPVTVWTGVSNISSWPVMELNFLLPEYEIPLSFIPV